MTTLYRCITDDDTSRFCHRVSEALSKGWTLHGGPSMAFDPQKGVMRMSGKWCLQVCKMYMNNV